MPAPLDTPATYVPAAWEEPKLLQFNSKTAEIVVTLSFLTGWFSLRSSTQGSSDSEESGFSARPAEHLHQTDQTKAN